MAKRTSGKTRRRIRAARNRIEPVEKPKFVWCEPTGRGRNVFVIFRRSFSLVGDAVRKLTEAHINLFADTRYRLWVNGQIVAYGPGRFVPKRPEYDRIDLRPWLAKGPNSIVVEVNSFGAKNFEAVPSIGGFIAWGAIGAGKTRVDLATPGEWRMQLSEAWDADAPAYSFAKAPAEICDTRQLPPGFREARFHDKAWLRPVPLAEQEAWGKPSSRSIPMLTMDLHRPEKLCMHAALATDEHVIAGRIPGDVPDGKGEPILCCFAVNIYSPIEQAVTLGLFWGPHYLNGQPIEPIKNGPRDRPRAAWNVPRSIPWAGKPVWCNNRGNREDYPVRLVEGWNFLYGEPGVLRGQQGIMLGLPTGKGLVASVDRNLDSTDAMIFSEGVPASELKSARKDEIPRSTEALPSLSVPWHRVARGSIAPLPARLIGWDTPAPGSSPPATPHTVEAIRIPANTPWVVQFDLGCERFGHVSLDIEAAAGTIFDIAYEERFREDGMVSIFHSSWNIDNADRFIAAGGRQRIEGFHQPSDQPGPDGQVFGDEGHAATIAFACDNGGSMMFDIGSLRHELSKAIEGLNPSQKFSITLLECGETEPYMDKDLIAATPENKKKADEFLDDICEGGITDPLVKLRLAFAQHPQLMYLLLTGDFGEMRGNQRVLDEIHKLDPNHKVRINTIAFTGSNDHDTDYLKLLKDLAAESGGKFRHVNVDDLK